jgi:hypothetical protein
MLKISNSPYYLIKKQYLSNLQDHLAQAACSLPWGLAAINPLLALSDRLTDDG